MRPKFDALRLLLLGVFATSHVVADSTLQLQSKAVLTMAVAQKMAMACVKQQRDTNGSPVAIAVYNDGANLIYFVSMDGTSSGTGTTAMAKGESSARFRTPSAEIAKWVQSNPAVGHVPGLLGVRGGLPIRTSSGKPLGGIGVSGAPSEVDEKCAQAGIDAITSELRDE
jgi:glc operon protein GlcG